MKLKLLQTVYRCIVIHLVSRESVYVNWMFGVVNIALQKYLPTVSCSKNIAHF